MSDDLDDLIQEGRQAEPRKTLPRERPSKTPEALVLFIQRKTCMNCGTIYEHPNHYILGRYQGKTSRMEEWFEAFNDVPREIHMVESQVAACQECFEDADLGSEVVRR